MFYCLELGHMKQNCWKKKLDYFFARLKESSMQKDEKKNKKKIKAEKAKQKKLELLIFQQTTWKPF